MWLCLEVGLTTCAQDVCQRYLGLNILHGKSIAHQSSKATVAVEGGPEGGWEELEQMSSPREHHSCILWQIDDYNGQSGWVFANVGGYSWRYDRGECGCLFGRHLMWNF